MLFSHWLRTSVFRGGSLFGERKYSHTKISTYGSAESFPPQRGSSDYSEQSLSCVDYNRESPEDTIPYRPRSSSPAVSEKEYSIPTPSPLSHNELSRLPLVVVEKSDLKIKECSCGKAWREGESVTQLYCSHRLHSKCAEQLLEKGVCPTCNSKNILDPKHREIKIDLSGFNF